MNRAAIRAAVLGLVLLAVYGSIFWTGIIKVAAADITGVVAVSWQGHLFGAIGGVLGAFLVGKADAPRRAAAKAARAISWMVLDAPEEFRALKTPAANSTSSGGASSIADAMTLASAMTLSQAETRAIPPTASDRDP